MSRTTEPSATRLAEPERRAGPQGVFVPILTPLDGSEQLDDDALRQLVDRLVGSVDGIFVLGTAGELATLRDDVATAAVSVVADQLAGRLPLVCGAGDSGTARTIERLSRAAEANADYVAVCGPYYYPSDSAGLQRHFAAVANASDVPVVLYNLPNHTRGGLDQAAVNALAGEPNIVGIKDSSGDDAFFSWLLATRDHTTWSVLQGTGEKQATAHWRSGQDGYVSGLENVAPGTMKALADAVATGDSDTATALQARIDGLVDLCRRHYWLSVLKAALAEQGIGSGVVCSPAPPLDRDARADVRQTLARIGLLN